MTRRLVRGTLLVALLVYTWFAASCVTLGDRFAVVHVLIAVTLLTTVAVLLTRRRNVGGH